MATPLLSRMADRSLAEDWPAYRMLRPRGPPDGGRSGDPLRPGPSGGGTRVAPPVGGRTYRPETHQLFWGILLLMGGFLVCGSPATFLTQSFYARRDVRTPTFVAMLVFTAGVGLKIAGFLSFGVLGIAGSASLVQILSLILLALMLKRSFRVASAPGPAAVGPA